MFISTYVKKIIEHFPFSIFPRATRPFTEPISLTEDRIIPKGSSLPDLIRSLYGSLSIKALHTKWGFLSRDDKEREYQPAVEDPFVAAGPSFPSLFKTKTSDLLTGLVKEGERLNLSTTIDKERRVTLIDTERLQGNVEEHANKPSYNVATTGSIQFMTGNQDILKKCALVRAVIPGWWAVSYKGKNATDPHYFVPALLGFKRCLQNMRKSAVFRSRYEYYWDTNGDPIDTNPGYPYFAGHITKDGIPVTRRLTVSQFKTCLEVARRLSDKKRLEWKHVLSAIDSLNHDENLAGHPLAIAPLRRLQPGYKWAHVFSVTANGMRTELDVRGYNTQRVAWMVPYVYNILISPTSVLLKTIRSFLPGCTHTATDKIFQNQQLDLRTHPHIQLFEADYSNYDRFIPVDIIRLILDAVTEVFIDDKEDRAYWQQAMMHLHDGASLIWPDYATTTTGTGWIFKPGTLGLMSGVKITSETGTLVNFIVNISNMVHAGLLNSPAAMDAYIQAIFNKQGASDIEKNSYKDLKSFSLKFLVQSDDTLLIGKDYSEGVKLRDAFTVGLQKAGLKGAVEFGDRFLMRHMFGGGDRPVPARVWQNSLSNESPPESELIFLLGLLARTDGMFGVKQVDPFNTLDKQWLTDVEFNFSLRVVKGLRQFFNEARVPSERAIQLMDAYVGLENEVSVQPGFVTIPAHAKKRILKLRIELTNYLIELERASASTLSDAKLFDAQNKYNSWILSLARDRNVPSAAAITDYVIAMDPTVGDKIKQVAAKEEAFFQFACSEFHISALQWS